MSNLCSLQRAPQSSAATQCRAAGTTSPRPLNSTQVVEDGYETDDERPPRKVALVCMPTPPDPQAAPLHSAVPSIDDLSNMFDSLTHIARTNTVVVPSTPLAVPRGLEAVSDIAASPVQRCVMRLPRFSKANRGRAHTISTLARVPHPLHALFSAGVANTLDILALWPDAQEMSDSYVAGITKLWPFTIYADSKKLSRAVDDAVLTMWLLRTKQPFWNALQQLSYFSRIVLLKPEQRARVRLFVEELWIPTTFDGAIDDLNRLTRSGPEAGALVDERRRFRRYAPRDWGAYFATLDGEKRRYVHSRIAPLACEETDMPSQPEATDDLNRPTLTSPLRHSTLATAMEA